MRRLYGLALVAFPLVAGVWLSLQTRPTVAQPGKPPAAEAEQSLPIRRVVLFSSGVGYFQRAGEITGTARIDLTFPVRDINDLIKSMVVQDDKGQVTAVSYDSLDPVERTLRSFAVNLTEHPSMGAILTQLRGEKVEITLQATTTQPGTITGSILGVETQKITTKEGTHSGEVLNLWCGDGVRAVKWNDVTRLKFLNPTIESEFPRALETLTHSHDAQKKAVSLNFAGEGRRQVQVSYVVENPIWKTSYRLDLGVDGKPFLQGWAVVDNPTDEDWNNVGMILVAGRPISFQMDLYQPLYVPRPMVALELFESLRPVAYEGGKELRKMPQAAKAARVMDEAEAPGSGDFAPAFAGKKAGANRLKDVDKEKESLSKQMDLRQGVQSMASASQLGDFFQYEIRHGVTLPRQKSALLPIVQQEMEGTRLSIYNPAVHPKFPMLGLKLKNTTHLHLMQGLITVFEASTYAGDARIQDLPKNDERLISYAVDLGTEVETKTETPPQQVVSLAVDRGVVIRTIKMYEEKTYTVTNRNGQARTVWIEHPYRPEFRSLDKEKWAERTSEFYRFEVKLPAEAKAAVRKTIREERDVATTVSISNADDGTIWLFLRDSVISEAVKQALQQALALRGKWAHTQQLAAEANQQLQEIHQDQTRMRENLKVLPTNSAPYTKSLDKFEKQELELDTLRAKIKAYEIQALQQRQEFEQFLSNLTAK